MEANQGIGFFYFLRFLSFQKRFAFEGGFVIDSARGERQYINWATSPISNNNARQSAFEAERQTYATASSAISVLP